MLLDVPHFLGLYIRRDWLILKEHRQLFSPQEHASTSVTDDVPTLPKTSALNTATAFLTLLRHIPHKLRHMQESQDKTNFILQLIHNS